jgi:TPR repeat protein
MTTPPAPEALALRQAEQLLDTPDTPSSAIARGAALLRELAQAGYGPALVRLSNRLWQGRGLAIDIEEAERLLRLAAANGVPLAMLVLGQRLAFGMGLEPDATEAEAWLGRAAATDFAPALEAYGAYLLANGRTETALSYLERAAEAGNLAAMTGLGAHLMDTGATARGEAWLRKAAAGGFARAHGLLGERLLARNPLEARALLAWALAHNEPRFGLVLGLERYQAGAYQEAITAFEASLALGATGARLNLAYMARRGEWPPSVPIPDIAALLATHLRQGDAGACVNMALWHTVQSVPDWEAADALMAIAAQQSEALSWWHALAQAGDAEGHLVSLWLARHGVTSPLPPATHLALARQGGRVLPDWLLNRFSV